jgi:hypothetical protein
MTGRVWVSSRRRRSSSSRSGALAVWSGVLRLVNMLKSGAVEVAVCVLTDSKRTVGT